MIRGELSPPCPFSDEKAELRVSPFHGSPLVGNQGVLGLPRHLGGLCEGLLAVSGVLSTPETKWELGRVGDTRSPTLPQVGDGASSPLEPSWCFQQPRRAIH